MNQLKWLAAFAQRRWRGLALTVGSFVLVYSALGFLLLPWWVGKAAPRFVAEVLGHELAIERIRFNPWTLVLQLEKLTLRPPGGAALAGFAKLRVNAELSSLWFRGVSLAEVMLESPSLDVVVDESGVLNLAGLKPKEPGAEPPEADADALPLRLRIDRLSVASGSATFEDLSRSSPFRKVFAPISFELSDFNTVADTANSFELTARSQIGERLAWSGRIDLEPLGSTGRVEIRDGKPESLWAYLDEVTAFRVTSGAADLDCDYSLVLREPVELRLEFPQIGLREVAIRPDDGETGEAGEPWIAVAQADLVDGELDLAAHSVRVSRVRIAGPALTVWRDAEGRINLAQLTGAGAEEAEATIENEERPAWTATLAALEIVEGVIDWSDRGRTPEAALRFEPVAVTLRDLSTDLAKPVALELDVGVAGSGRLAARGSVMPAQPSAELEVTLTALPLVPFQPYVSRGADVQIRSGTAGLSGQLAFAGADASPAARFEGSINVDDFATIDDALEEAFLNWKHLGLEGVNLALGPASLDVATIAVQEPYVRAIVTSAGQFNVTQVLRGGDEAANDADDETAQDQPGGEAIPIRIARITVENGSADFADFSIEPDFATGIQSLNGSVSGLSSAADARATVDLEGRVGRYSPVTISGEVNPLAAQTYLDLEMKFANIELPIFNPYSGKFAGYNIAKGKLTTELDYTIENRELAADHHMVIDQLEFGEETGSKDAVSLPLKLAVALLKDRNGVIELDLPVSGNLDDPRFRIGPIIWKAFVGLLTKIVTAPFALLGAIFGGGEELSFLDFPAASPELTPAAIDKIATLARALTERPGLRLDVPAVALRDVDAPVMVEQEFEERYRAALAASGDTSEAATPAERLAVLEQVYRSTIGSDPVYPEPEPQPEPETEPAVDPLVYRSNYLEQEIRDALAVNDAALEDLGRQRAEAVVAALLASGEITPERIFIVSNVEAKPGEGQSVRLELSLK